MSSARRLLKGTIHDSWDYTGLHGDRTTGGSQLNAKVAQRLATRKAVGPTDTRAG